MQVNVRDHSEESRIERITFGKQDEYLEECFDSPELIFLHDPSEFKSLYILKEDIDFLINALERAKQEWT